MEPKISESTEAVLEHTKRTAEYFRLKEVAKPFSVQQLISQFRMLIEQVMSEATFYSESHAAIALKQAEGDCFEAVQILRAQKYTLPRNYKSEIVDTRHMFVERRISSAFREIPGGQILGPSRDYTQRLLEPTLASENLESIEEFLSRTTPSEPKPYDEELNNLGKVADLLRKEGLMKGVEDDDQTVVDITREPVKFPAPRSARLQMLARAQTGSMLAIGYSGQRGFGGGHGTVGELRVGKTLVRNKDAQGRTRTIGRIRLTEAEMITRITSDKKNSVPSLAIGYGLCFCQNETKAISMGGLDRSMRRGNDEFPCQSQEFLMHHCEADDAWGSINSLKMPAHVEFASSLNLVRQSMERLPKQNSATE
jgi:alpha-D-ribose 1-methylphosphonate 5-triphosphate synthase subunit PhnI